MKKLISVILALTVTFSVCSIAVSAEENEADLKIAVGSDLHYCPVSDELDKTNDDEIFWYANRRAALEEESEFIIDEFLDQCKNDDSIDYVLIPGDLADDGRQNPEDHEYIAAKLEAFEKESGKEVFVINGNHDACADAKTTYTEFKEIYKNLGYDHAITVARDDCSYAANLGSKYLLIALDTNNPDESTEDGMTAEKLNWVRQQVELAEKTGRYPIVMMHHNLLDHLPLQRIISRNFIVRFHYSTATLFADWGIKIVLSGHEHCSDVTSYTTVSGNVIYDFANTSLTMYPLSYRIFTFSDESITYENRTVDSIDTEALLAAQNNFTKVQTDEMNKGMNEYALKFLKTGVEYRLALSLSAEKIGVEEGDIFYDVVMTAVDGLTDLLEMPLYGENSVKELAAEYGIDIPDSNYENLWDLVTTLVSTHYAGEENLNLDSTEVTILLRALSLILKDDLSNYNDELILSYVTDLLENNGMSGITNTLTKLCSSAFGGIRPDEYMAAAILAPFLYEFAFDDDDVNDSNGTIDGYAVNKKAENISNNLNYLFSKILTYLKLYFSFIAKIFA